MERVLPLTPSSPAEARRQLDQWLGASLPEDALADVRLAATEVVSNAVRHGGLAAGAEILLTVMLARHTIYVEVRQPSVVDVEPRLPAPRPDGGYGLLIVESVSERWGTVRGPPGAVWFELLRR